MNIDALKKIAGIFNRSAGIGNAKANKIDKLVPRDGRDSYYSVNDGSYYGNLHGNAENEDDRTDVAFASPNGRLIIGSRPGDPLSKPNVSEVVDAIPPRDDVPQKWLEESRRQMAISGADKVLGGGKGIRDTQEWQMVYKNLMHAGQSNQDEFRKNKKVHKRDAYELDQHGLGPLLKNLTPEQKKRLLQRQNIQASVSAPASSVKKAQAGGLWESVRSAIEEARKRWQYMDPQYKPLVSGLIGGGIGSGAGAILGKLFGFGARRGALAGLGLGGMGGALYGANSVSSKHLKDIEGLKKQVKFLGDDVTRKDFYDRRKKDVQKRLNELAEKSNPHKVNDILVKGMKRRRDMQEALQKAVMKQINMEDGKAIPANYGVSDDIPVGVDL